MLYFRLRPHDASSREGLSPLPCSCGVALIRVAVVAGLGGMGRMTRAEMIDTMCAAFVGPDIWLLIDDEAKARRRARMGVALDVIEPVITRAEKMRAWKARLLFMDDAEVAKLWENIQRGFAEADEQDGLPGEGDEEDAP